MLRTTQQPSELGTVSNGHDSSRLQRVLSPVGLSEACTHGAPSRPSPLSSLLLHRRALCFQSGLYFSVYFSYICLCLCVSLSQCLSLPCTLHFSLLSCFLVFLSLGLRTPSSSPGCSVPILHPPQIFKQPVPHCPSPSGLSLPTSVLCVRGTFSPSLQPHTCSLFLGSISLGLGPGLSQFLCLYPLILRGQYDACLVGKKTQEKNTRARPGALMEGPAPTSGG